MQAAADNLRLRIRSRPLQITLSALGLIVAALVLCYFAANVSAHREWQEYLQSNADGEHYVSPPAVPDADNFVKTDLWVRHGYFQPGNASAAVVSGLDANALPPHAIGNFRAGTWTRLDYLQSSLLRPDPAQAAAEARGRLTVFPMAAHRLAELRSAARRGSSRFDMGLSYEAPMVDFGVLRQVVRLMQFHSILELLVANADGAAQDIEVLFQVSSGLRDHPSIVGVLIRTAVINSILQPFYEGWARRQWTPKQYAYFQEFFEKVHLLQNLHVSLLGERDSIRYMVTTRSSRDLIEHLGFVGVNEVNEPVRGLFEQTYLRSMPRGWWMKNLARHQKIMDRMRSRLYNLDQQRVFPEQASAIDAWLDDEIQSSRPFHHIASLGIPRISRALRTIVEAQTSCDQAIIICAIERYKHDVGTYPEDLHLLVPLYLNSVPRDLTSGDYPIYQSLRGETFHLYSIGWDGIDDGGILSQTNDFVTPGFDYIWPWQAE